MPPLPCVGDIVRWCGIWSQREPLSTTPERQRDGSALEAITPSPRAQRESRSSPELPVGRRTHPAEPMPTDHTQQRVPSLGTYANNPLMTSPAMSVSRKSRPSKRCVKRVCSMPNR